jgi:PilZ domain-containing protein
MTTEYVQGSPGGLERRRAVRRPVNGQSAAISLVVSVQVMDVSRTGVLFATDSSLAPGSQGTLCLDINGNAFRAEIKVQRVARARVPGDRHELGASFLTTTIEHDLLLRRIQS